MANLPTGGLTPRSNNKEVSCRYTGGFGQPDGFASVLDVTVNDRRRSRTDAALHNRLERSAACVVGYADE